MHGIKGLLKTLLYAQCFLGLIPAFLMLWVGFSPVHTTLLIAGFLILVIAIVCFLALKYSDRQWAKYTLLILAILTWIAFFVEIFVERQSGIFALLFWSFPLTAYVYLLFKEQQNEF